MCVYDRVYVYVPFAASTAIFNLRTQLNVTLLLFAPENINLLKLLKD